MDSRIGTWMHRAELPIQRCIGLLIVLGALVGCSPPVELAGRAVTPLDVTAASLLPPGKSERFEWPSASDGAEVTTANGAHFRAVRFASEADARRGFEQAGEALLLRSEAMSKSSVNVGSLQYMRYGGAHVSGLIWVSGTWLFGAEARDAALLEALIAASRAGGTGDAGVAGSPLLMAILMGLAAIAAIAVMVLFIRLLIRRLAARPAADAPMLTQAALVVRLLALNDPGRPWIVRRGPEADLVVEWKYADASWWGVLGKAGAGRAYRLRLYFDEARHRCGVLDELGTVDWSAGLLSAPRVHFERSFFRGIQLANVERGVAYGFGTPIGGGAGKVLDYKFDISEVKQPVIDVVCAAGWTFQPILWPPR